MKYLFAVSVAVAVAAAGSVSGFAAEPGAGSVAGAGAALAWKWVERPYLLWTKADLAAMKKRVETEAWAGKAYEEMVKSKEANGDEMRNLFRYAVMGDKAAGEVEKKKLLGLLKAPDPLGGALEYRLLAYDLLYGELSEQERKDLEGMFRRYIPYSIKPGGAFDSELYNNTKNPPYSRYDGEDGKYTRTNWLPNIIWPRKISANLMAVAMEDEKLVRELWSTKASWKWYFDEYLSDWGFYSEEFSKMTSTPGAMYIYCMGVKNLGMDELGFGYTGTGGATMRGHLETVMQLTYPRVDLGTTRPTYPRVTEGDLRQYWLFQHRTVNGYHADGTGGNELFRPAGAWGGTTRGKSDQWDNDKTEKWSTRMWFEMGHKMWPDAGFDYFLAQMRGPDDDKYYPTLYFNLDPIDPAKVKAPAAKSWIAPQRGIVMLRADETPASWESKAPVVAMRLASPYAHHVNDSFALAGFYAMGRPIYANPQPLGAYAFGYSRSIRSHCGVMVDGEIKVDDWGQTGSKEPGFTEETAIRKNFAGDVKFVAARTQKVYEGVDQTRALFLTDAYLMDVYALESETPRTYTWMVHTWGSSDTGGGEWKASTELGDLIPQMKDVVGKDPGGRAWSVTTLQTAPKEWPVKSPVNKEWFDRKVGVRMTMLGEAGQKAFVGATPKLESARQGEQQLLPQAEGITIVSATKAKGAVFAALHEPYEGAPKLSVKELAREAHALAAAVTGGDGAQAVNDRVLIRWGADEGKVTTLGGDGEDFTFAGSGFVRITKDEVRVSGDVRSMRVRVGAGTPKLVVNGKGRAAKVEAGMLVMARE